MSFYHRAFHLERTEDVSGISGTGKVAEGVQFTDRTVVLRWCVPGKPQSTVIHENMEAVQEIHGHDGKTRVIWQ